MYIRKRLWNCNWSLVTLSMHSVPWSQPSAERGRLQVAWLAWYKDTGYRTYQCPKLHNMEPLKGFKVLFLQPGRVAWQQQGTTQRRLRWWLSPPRFPLLTGHLNTSLGERTRNPDNFPCSDCLKKSFSPWTHQFFFIWHSPEQLGSSSSSESTCQGKISQESNFTLLKEFKEISYGLQTKTSPTASICPFSLQQVKGLKAGFHLNLWKGKHQTKMAFLYFFPFFVQV